MKKFLGKLFTFALYAFVIGAIAKAGYDMFGDTEKLKKEAEMVARFKNYVPEEVSPYTENLDGANYYYKSMGGELYAGNWQDIEGIPTYATMSQGDSEDKDITDYFSYDENVHTYIIKEELLSTLENGDYCVNVHYEEDVKEEFWFTVREELENNVPAERVYRAEPYNDRIYNRLSDLQEISLYFCNIGDNRIVDVLICSGGSAQGVLAPENYIIASAGNKVTFKKEYLESLEPNTSKQYGVRLADGTILSESPDFWTIKDEWRGCVFEDVKDYSLSEGGDYVIHIKRNDTDRIFSFNIESENWEEGIKYVEENDMEWGGSDYYVPGGNTITVPEDVMKTLPVNKELKMYVTYCFDYERKIWGSEFVLIKVVP